MKTTTLSIYSQNQNTLQVLNDFGLTLTMVSNPLNLPYETLFSTATRVNKKRGFLFVSKVLGKHCSVHPLKPLLISGLLAIEYFEQTTGLVVESKTEIINGLLSDNPFNIEKAYQILSEEKLVLEEELIIIGFAETATALGHAVFDCLDGSFFIHTSREMVKSITPQLEFSEEHSHAVEQYCYIGYDQINNDKPIILVDDEITTGKTALNIIRNIHSQYPRGKYAVLSILDWRTEDHKEQFRQLEKRVGYYHNHPILAFWKYGV